MRDLDREQDSSLLHQGNGTLFWRSKRSHKNALFSLREKVVFSSRKVMGEQRNFFVAFNREQVYLFSQSKKLLHCLTKIFLCRVTLTFLFLDLVPLATSILTSAVYKQEGLPTPNLEDASSIGSVPEEGKDEETWEP